MVWLVYHSEWHKSSKMVDFSSLNVRDIINWDVNHLKKSLFSFSDLGGFYEKLGRKYP